MSSMLADYMESLARQIERISGEIRASGAGYHDWDAVLEHVRTIEEALEGRVLAPIDGARIQGSELAEVRRAHDRLVCALMEAHAVEDAS